MAAPTDGRRPKRQCTQRINWADYTYDSNSSQSQSSDIDLDQFVRNSSDDGNDSDTGSDMSEGETWCYVVSEADDPTAATITNARRFDFDINVGPKDVPESVKKPFEYFELFITDELLNRWANETEKYAKDFIDENKDKLPENSRVHSWDWENLSMDDKVGEIKAYVALTILMGLVKKPSIEDYWDKTHFSVSTPAFGEVMSLKRYQLLSKFFHISDNKAAPAKDSDNYDPLFKVAGFIEHLNEKYIHYYVPSRDVAVDESLVGFKGRHRVIQYMPNKHHHQWGPKMWVGAETSSGYTFKFDFYRGSVDKPSEKGLTYDVVMRMMAPLLGKGYHCVMDNYYTSPDVCTSLYEQQTASTGTIRQTRRGFPQELKEAKPNRGEVVYMRYGSLLAAKWRDKREVCFLSTTALASSKTVKRSRRDEEVTIPEVVDLYNKGMGGVDLADQKIDNYSGERATLKCWKKITFHLLDRTLLNAYILYVQHTTDIKILSHKSFIIQCMENWLLPQKTKNENKAVMPRGRALVKGQSVALNSEGLKHVDSWHFQMPIPPREDVNDVSKQCQQCAKSKIRKRTKYHCGYCPEKPGLCPGACFRSYHMAKKQ